MKKSNLTELKVDWVSANIGSQEIPKTTLLDVLDNVAKELTPVKNYYDPSFDINFSIRPRAFGEGRQLF